MKTKLRLVGGLTAGLIVFGGLTACGGSDAKTEEKTTETTAKGGTETTKAGATETTKAAATATTTAAAGATTTAKK
jgi:hypothetical protein